MNSDQDKIIHWIREICLHDEPEIVLTEDSVLLEEGLLDSMKVIQLVSLLEDMLGRPLPIDEVTAENFESPKRIAAMIRRLRDTNDDRGSGRS
jgi:acyl carrier protein